MKKTIATIENKVTGTVITQTLLSNGTASVSVQSPYDTSKVYQSKTPSNQLRDLFKSFGDIYTSKNLKDGQ